MKTNKINYFLIGLALFAFIVSLLPVAHWDSRKQESLAGIKSRGVLRVSTLASSLTWQQSKNQPTGIDYELAKRFADYLGVRLEVRACPTLAALFADLDSGNSDLLAAGLNWNSARAQKYQASPSFYTSTQQLVYRTGGVKPRNLGEIKGKLAVPSASSYLTLLEQQKQKNFPNLVWQTVADKTPRQLLQELAAGAYDYTLTDSVIIDDMQHFYPQLAVAFTVERETPVNWYFKRSADNELAMAVADFYAEMDQQKVLTTLAEKYFGHSRVFDYIDTQTFLRAIDKMLPVLQPVFEKYAQELDWHLLAAVAWQESHWDALATSPTGVRGMMMLTQTTASSLNVDDRLNVEQSIRGGSEYLQSLLQRVPQSINEDERIWFALAAYNIGYAHIQDARKLTQRQGGNPDSWTDVKSRLPMLEQKRYYLQTTYGFARGQEAYRYVENIRNYTVSLVGYLRHKNLDNVDNTQLVMN